MIRMGQRVRVYPHGDESQAAVGEVLLISSNQRSIAIRFADKPPFVNIARDGAFIGFDGLVMLASREAIDGKPWGPWVEVTNDGHYEIEDAPDSPAG